MRLESEGCTRWFFTPTSLIDEWIREDTAYTDFTTSVLGISRAPGRARLTTRERIAAYGLREAALVYEKLGAKARLLHPEGEWAEPGTALEAEGPAAALHAALEASPDDSIHGLRRRHLHAAAGRARQDSNPRIVVAMARKAPPGIRHVYYRCVFCGGATLHRLGLSETILVLRNHVVFLGGLEKALERLHRTMSQSGERSVVEAETP